MPIRMQATSEVATAYLSGELDHHTAKEMREAIDSALNQYSPKLLIMDFGDVSFMDSSGIGLVMGRYRQMQLLGGELHVVNTSKRIYQLMKLAGLEKLSVLKDRQSEKSTAGNRRDQ